MAANLAKRKRSWFRVESLETRALLSAGAPKVPIGVPAPALPAIRCSITAEISPKSDPDGNGVVLTPRVTIVGRTAPADTRSD